MYKFSNSSLSKMKGVDGDLILVMVRAIQLSPVDFGITEGLRTQERQDQLLRQGRSLTKNSRHLIGQAVDVVAYDEHGMITWDIDYYSKINTAVQKAASELDVTVTWGGNWLSFRDGPHFQIEKG